jgi:acyl-CoA thioester hydrolase
MSRVKLKFPTENILLKIAVHVRITDINYGGHLGNDSVLSIIHEARVQLLGSWGFSEMDAGGTSLIMADVMIAYKGEAFYGDLLNIKIYAEELTPYTFDLLYHISMEKEENTIDVAHAKTTMVCYDYEQRKKVLMTEALKGRLSGK